MFLLFSNDLLMAPIAPEFLSPPHPPPFSEKKNVELFIATLLLPYVFWSPLLPACRPRWRHLVMSGGSRTVVDSKSCNHHSSPPPSTATPGWKSITTQQTRGRNPCPQSPTQLSRLFSHALRRRTHQKRCKITKSASMANFHRRHRQYVVFVGESSGSLPASSPSSSSPGLLAGEWGVTSRQNPPRQLRATRQVPTRRDRIIIIIPQRRRPDLPSKTSASLHWAGSMKAVCDRFESTTQHSGIRPIRPGSWNLPGTLPAQNGPSRPSRIRLSTVSSQERC